MPNPERLTKGRFGPLLEEGSRELADGLDQSAAFQRLSERLSTSRAVLAPGRVYWFAPAVVLVLAAFAVLPTIAHRMRSSPVTVIAAEDLPGHREHPLGPAAPSTESSAPPPPRITIEPPERSASGTRHIAHAPSGSPSGTSSALPSVVEQAPESKPAQAPESAGSVVAVAPSVPDLAAVPDCLSLARGGQTRDAEACFLKRAEGGGLGAEMALYEVARLRRDVLGDAAGALRALAEYRTRFPAGSLRREADMSQLELLVQLGRTDEALKQSEALLSSSASGERAVELHLLRGHILRKTRSFSAAAHEYELAESGGARRGDVSYFHALCLEALGRGPEAAALFTRYLEQPQHSYAEDARRRLERLKP
ncbi:MAG TPA: hypothetical protein VER11_08685 [Polyangiaceae bacterium]|nr:hypothetical protein [Polyangiaceae bacterium]